MNTIYLVRHGENPANLLRQFSHRLVDYSLTERGVRQAEQTALFFRDTTLDEVYASPLKRAIETAQIIAQPHRLPVNIIEEFREVNVGHMEADPSPENWAIHDQIFDDWHGGKHDSGFPGGENYHTLLERMRNGLAHVLAGKTGKRIVIVSHAGIMMSSIAGICPECDLAGVRTNGLKNCAITELSAGLVAGSLHAELVRWGMCDHLSD